MPDKMEREIEEILARLDRENPGKPLGGDRAPISIASRQRRKHHPVSTLKTRLSAVGNRFSPATLLLGGAGVMVAGLILSNVWPVAIWASFAGVVLFLAAFVWSFTRSSTSGGKRPAGATRGHYWRDRYIEYEPGHTGMFDRLKRKFRR